MTYPQKPLRPSDVYSSATGLSALNAQWEAIDFRPPQRGESFINTGYFVDTATSDWLDRSPRIIVRKRTLENSFEKIWE